MYLKKIVPIIFMIGALLFSPKAKAQNWDQEIEKNLLHVLREHREFVSIPCTAADTAGILQNIEWLENAFSKRGFEVEILKTRTHPVFLAKRTVNPQAKTILFYMHLDGQPVAPKNWQQEDPFEPVLKQMEGEIWKQIPWKSLGEKIDPEWRIFARAAADDKGPIIMMLSALDILKKNGLDPSYNVKIILDAEEEAGSAGFKTTIYQYKEKYVADYLIIMDGPAHPTNRPTLTFGCRGNATFSMTTYGPMLPQHSGHYGNYAPNPVFKMAHLLASMKDEEGRVLIKNFYEGIEINQTTEKEVLKAVPDDQAAIQRTLGIAEIDKVGEYYQEALQYPSLNVRHIETSWKGPGIKTIIPEITTAHIDMRLVPETDGLEQLEKVRTHIKEQGYYLLDRPPTFKERLSHPKILTFKGNSGVNAFRTNFDAPIGKALYQSLSTAFGEPPVRIRIMGGTVPIAPVINILGIPAIIVPMVNMDNNQHNPNENLRIGNLITGIKMVGTILQMDI